MAAATLPPPSQRPEWADVVPLPANEGPCIVAIKYARQHEELLGYFRAVYASGEKSERVLALTSEVIDVNPAHYTAWQWRWECLLALGCDLEEELQELAIATAGNSKNYQLWNQRRKCALALGRDAVLQELRFSEGVLDADAKNYHVWAHRQALAAAHGLWAGERDFSARMLADDVYNNSAWAQRMFALRGLARGVGANTPVAAMGGEAEQEGGGVALSDGEWAAELEFVSSAVGAAPSNEAPWSYLVGLADLRAGGSVGSGGAVLAQDGRVAALVGSVLEGSPSCVPALALLAEAYCTQAAGAAGMGQTDDATEARGRAVAVYGALVVADPLRTPYWRHCQALLLHVTT